jgi:adenylate cyclase
MRAQALISLGAPPEEIEAAHRKTLEIVENHVRMNPDDSRAFILGSAARLALGDQEGGLAWARRAQEIAPGEPMILYNVACTYCLAGEPEEALAALEKAVDEGFGHKAWVEHDSDLAPLHGHPRYQALLDRM